MIASYFSVYEKECNSAISFIDEHPEIRTNLESLLGNKENASLAISVVLPELSQFTSAEDYIQSRMMFILYIHYGLGNFSIGAFQMKPSFAQQIENIVANDRKLLSQFKDLIIEDSNPSTVRHERIKRLCSLKWEIKYLAAFYKIAEHKIKGWPLAKTSIIKKLQYISTLYNGGLNLSFEETISLMQKSQFPHMSTKQFNYSNCSVEFYNIIKNKNKIK